MIEKIDSTKLAILSTALRALIAIAILAAAGSIFYFLILNPAKTEKVAEEKDHALHVSTQDVQIGTHPVIIEVMGQVTPAKEIELKSRVSGEILEASQSFIPGGIFAKDEQIIQIDRLDYELALKVAKANQRQALAALQLELGQQEIAKDELKVLEQTTGKKLKNSDLALRKPQLEQARADLDSAKANLDVAELDLKRTKLSAPFNAIITERTANLGDIISAQDTIATLVGTDEYWIETEVPIQYLHWINAHENDGSDAIINLNGINAQRRGIVKKIAAKLDEKSRMATVIISVDDPLLLTDKSKNDDTLSPLILGDFVRLKLIGRTLENVVRLPSERVRDEQTIWLERDSKLLIQKIDIAYQDRHFVYITKGLKAGDKVVTTDIITPVSGMDIVVNKDDTHSNP